MRRWRIQEDFGLADAFLTAAGERKQAIIVTGDPNSRGKKDVIFLK